MESMQGLGQSLEPKPQACLPENTCKGSGSLQRSRRPGYGNSKKYEIRVVTNFYRMNFNKEHFYHYDVDITPFDPRSQQFTMDENMPGKEKCRQIMFELIKREKGLEQYMPVYDGQKNLFTCKPLPLKSQGHCFEVPLIINGREKLFLFRIKPVVKKNDAKDNIISLLSLQDYISGKTSVVPSEVHMVLECILSHRPPDARQMKIVNSFFPSNPRTFPLGDGCDVWFGYGQTVRLTEEGASLIVNTAAVCFHRSGPVLEKVREMFRGIPSGALGRKQVDKLKKALKTVRVRVTHQRFPRRYRIHGMAKPARYQEIEINIRGGMQKMSVEDYFYRTYKKKLQYPTLPCLEMESSRGPVYMPMEVCEIVPGQRVGKLDGDKAGRMIKNTAIPPKQKFDDIQRHAEHAVSSNSSYLNGYGLDVELNPTVVTSRVLNEPTISYSGATKCRPSETGVWNVEGHFAEPVAGTKRWQLISFVDDRFYNFEKLKQFSSILSQNGKKYGLNLHLVDIKRCGSDISTETILKDAKEKLKCDLLVCIVSPSDEWHPYDEIKFLGDIKYNLPTQCVDGTKEKINNVVLSNICLKINTKLGGINHFVSVWPIALQREGVIVIGADVVHNVALGCPSIAAVVGSVDFTLSNYAVSCRAQSNIRGTGRSQEIILDMKEMVSSILINFYRSTKKRKPEKILFYRDGVSEGQYDHVLQHEIPLIKAACHELSDDYDPPLTFVVVQKRHAVRFRPENPSDGVGRYRNVPPGTTIDTDIVDPVNHDFFLCSHEGIQGTSKPAHYTVLYDQNGVRPDVIQELSYYLCHVCARCNRSISIPTPVKYADLLAFRASKYVNYLLAKSPTKYRVGDPIPDDVQQMLKGLEKKRAKLFFI